MTNPRRIFSRIIVTMASVMAAALLWLYLLEELGFGTWECFA